MLARKRNSLRRESWYREEMGHLAAEIQKLRQLLHASQESEVRVVGKAEAMKVELKKSAKTLFWEFISSKTYVCGWGVTTINY